MLILEQDLFIAKGALRSTYHHPNDESLCIKINHRGDDKLSTKRQLREVKLYSTLQKKGVSFRNIARFVGEVETDRGAGFLYEKVTDHDGDISQDLRAVLTENENNKDILQSIKELGNFLVAHKIFFHDGLLIGNTLCSKQPDSSYRLVIVDALGDTILIPVLNLIDAHANKRMIRKWNKYMVQPILKLFPWVDRNEISLEIEQFVAPVHDTC